MMITSKIFTENAQLIIQVYGLVILKYYENG